MKMDTPDGYTEGEAIESVELDWNTICDANK